MELCTSTVEMWDVFTGVRVGFRVAHEGTPEYVDENKRKRFLRDIEPGAAPR